MTREVISLEDVGGSFARFIQNAPKEVRKRIGTAVLLTAVKLEDRMKSNAPVGPEAPHIRDAVTFKHRGMTASIGYLEEDFGGMEAGDGNTATMAEVALYNEYNPNKQPFMKPAAESERSDFVRRVSEALASMERFIG